MTKHIEYALKKIGKGNFVNILLSPHNYDKFAGSKLTNHLIRRKIPIIYITSNKPSAFLQKNLGKKEKESIFFVDMVSGSGSVFSKTMGNTLFTPTPNSLTEVGISVSSSDIFKGKKKIVVLDSIPSLIHSNGEETVLQFINFLRQRIDSAGDSGLLISIVDKDEDPIVTFASRFFHEIVKVEKVE